jgi:hypothetical protein
MSNLPEVPEEKLRISWERATVIGWYWAGGPKDTDDGAEWAYKVQVGDYQLVAGAQDLTAIGDGK